MYNVAAYLFRGIKLYYRLRYNFPDLPLLFTYPSFRRYRDAAGDCDRVDAVAVALEDAASVAEDIARQANTKVCESQKSGLLSRGCVLSEYKRCIVYGICKSQSRSVLCVADVGDAGVRRVTAAGH